MIHPSETCDDRNQDSFDGCSSSCQLEPGFTCPSEGEICLPTCGDKLIVSKETCDDGNQISSDGCSDQCEVELGWNCEDSSCQPICGDLIALKEHETCDDGNQNDGDGCSSNCHLEQITISTLSQIKGI